MTKCRIQISNVAMVSVLASAVITSFMIASCTPTNKATVSKKNEKATMSKKNEKATESKNPKLMPIDEVSENADFKKFRNQLQIAVKDKDLEFIKDHLDENIINSFGGNNGVEEFLEQWELNENPEESSLWYELGEVLRLGGIFLSKEKTSFIAPYVFSAFPDNYDSFIYGAIIDKNVNLRAQPSVDSKAVAKLSYDIVEILDNGQDDNVWRKIKLADGTEGYVAKEHLRSPIDYRCEFEKSKEDSVWRMKVFVAGD